MFEYGIKIVKYVFIFVHSSIRLQKKIRKCLNNLHSIFKKNYRELFNYLFQTSCLTWKEIALQFLVITAITLQTLKISALSGH